MYIFLCVLLCSAGFCHSSLTEKDFKSAKDISNHFNDINSGMLVLMSNYGNIEKQMMNLKINNTKLKQHSEILSNKITSVEQENMEKNKQISSLLQSITSLKQNMESLRAQNRKQLLNFDERNYEKFVMLSKASDEKTEQLATLKTTIELSQQKMKRLSQHFKRFKISMKNMNRNKTQELNSVQKQSDQLLEYVRNKTIQDIKVHVRVNRMQNIITKLQQHIHEIKQQLKQQQQTTIQPTTTSSITSTENIAETYYSDNGGYMSEQSEEDNNDHGKFDIKRYLNFSFP